MATDEPLLSDDKHARPAPDKMILPFFYFTSFTNGIVMSQVVAYLPLHFTAIGVEQIWVGIIFAAYPLAGLLATPLAKFLAPRLGHVRCIIIGTLLFAIGTFVCGYADDMTGGAGVDVPAAKAVYILSRMMAGGGSSMSAVSVLAIVVENYGSKEGEEGKDRLGEVNGLNEAIAGMGIMVGPVIGNALYVYGGWLFPFQVMGAVALSTSPMALLLRSSGEDAKKKQEMGMMEALNLEFVIAGMILLIGCLALGVLDPVMAIYLKTEVGITQKWLGLYLGLAAMMYGFSAAGWGVLADRIGPMKVSIIGVIAMGLVMAVLLGPLASVFFAQGSTLRIIWETVALCLLGITIGAAFIPTLSAMEKSLGDAPGKSDCVSAWVFMLFNGGFCGGPVLGSYIVQVVGFESAMAIMGSVVIVLGVVSALVIKLKGGKAAAVEPQTMGTA